MEQASISDSPSILAADIANFMSRYERLKGARRRFKPLVKVLMKLNCIPSKSRLTKRDQMEQEAMRNVVRVTSDTSISDSDEIISEMEDELTTIYGPMNIRGDEDLYIALERMEHAGHIEMLRRYAMNHYVDGYKNPFRRKMYGRRKWLEHIHE